MNHNPPIIEPQTCLDISSTWLAKFTRAFEQADAHALRELFLNDCHLRNVLALGWRLQTHSGVQPVCDALLQVPQAHQPVDLRIDSRYFPPHHVQRSGEWTLECVVACQTSLGACEGVLRLRQADDGQWRAWSLMLALHELKGHEEVYRRAQDLSVHNKRSFKGPNWKDERHVQDLFNDREPQVLVVGAGQAGLSVGARLRQLGVDVLLVDQNDRVGDNWRNRYHALVLHNQRHVNHLPYMPFPETWPTYIPKDKLADWFEFYAAAMELSVWTGTRFVTAQYDTSNACWDVTLESKNGTRHIRPAHIIMAAGVSAIPNRKNLPELAPYAGPVMHSADYTVPDIAKHALVTIIGTGTSAHDVAQDLAESGVQVIMVQRSPTMVQNIEPTAQLPYAIYGKELPNEACDLLTVGTTMAQYKASSRLSLKVAEHWDKTLIENLKKTNFKVNVGEDGKSWQLLYLTRGGGYYFNVGCSDLIIQRQIRVVQFDEIAAFEAGGMALKSGEQIDVDLVITATGYLGQNEMVRRLLGDEVADRVGPVWDISESSQELNNMWMQTPQAGLWFCAGSLAQCRIYSKYLSLQIQAQLLGLMA